MVRHPDGRVFAGGSFSQAGGVSANRIALWDGVAWSSINAALTPAQLTPRVHAMAVMPNGDLIVAGHFGGAGGITTNHIARWNGTTWSALGGGVSGASSGNNPAVFSLLVLPDGDLIVGGEFTTAGSTPAMRIARWDGEVWHALGAGFGSLSSYTPVYGLALAPSGAIIAGGQFLNSGALGLGCIASWSGSAWSALSTGMTNSGSPAIVRALAFESDGALIAAGRFNLAGGVAARSIARWNGVAWASVGGNVGSLPQHEVVALALSPSGEITVGGTFDSVAGSPASAIARWNGSTWSTFLGGSPPARSPRPACRAFCFCPAASCSRAEHSSSRAAIPPRVSPDGPTRAAPW